MQKRKCLFSALFSVLVGMYSLFAANGSRGQELGERMGIGLYGSAVKMVLGRTDRSTVDQWGGVVLSYGFSDTWVLSLKGGYGWVYPRDPNGSQFRAAGNYKTLLMPLVLTFDFIPLSDRSFRPYFTVGGGVLQWDLRNMRGTTSFLDRGTSVRSQVNANIVAGLGLQKVYSDRLTVSLFFQFHRLLKGNEDTIGTGDDNRAVAEFGLSLVFWGVNNRDSDGDGIPDRLDLCPYEMEDYDGYKDLDGCPDLDNDGDGIPDLVDKCPDLPEDKDGFEDNDGCPDPDNDRDGILDTKDKCPNQPEDFDGFQDEDGCPDPDNDHDGIPDEKDHCPNQPETVNGYQDEDGCPDEKPPLLKAGEKLVLRAVHFQTASAVLLPESYAALDSIYRWLAENPDVELEIRGYTDSVGEWEYNLKLSQRRADAVRRYFIKRGIAPERLRAVGYGEANPIASNATKAGRAANRRIEFVRIQ